MKTMNQLKKYIFMALAAYMSVSCSDFLDTSPKDSMTPDLTWKTEDDAQKFAVGCYDKWEEGSNLLYYDCGSDFGYNNFEWEKYKLIGNGAMSAGSANVEDLYDFTIIRRCNEFLEKTVDIPFADEQVKKDLIAQVRTIRAYRYFLMNWYYGGVPIIDLYNTADEARIPRDSEETVLKFINDELDAAIADINTAPAALGRIAKGGAMAIRMRTALYYNDFQKAKDMADAIMKLKQYELEPNYDELFKVSGQGSKEIILAVQYLNTTRPLGVVGQMYNNADGGWSSIVPTQNLVDSYELTDGLTKEESPLYDPVHPFANRDPRMEMTVMYPGMNWRGGIINTLDATIGDKANTNYPSAADNASKTALTWRKYLDPMDQYANGIWNTNASPILIRYAEVLLSYAEAANELSGPSADVYDQLDLVRQRVGMPKVNRTKYNTKESLRELIRRERAVELAGEGSRRADILRWKDSAGKMVAETVLNETLQRIVGTINYSESDPTKRATINVNAPADQKKIEDRVFKPHNRYNPIPQSARDKNPKLVQNDGYQ